MKKLLCVFLTTAMVLAMGACGGDKTGKAPVGTRPVYTSGNKYEVGMWVGISDTHWEYDETGKKIPGSGKALTDEEFLEKYREIAEAGITIAYPGYDVMSMGNRTYNLKALRAAKEAGIKHIIHDPDLSEYLTNAKILADTGISTEEQIVQEVANKIRPYTESEYADALYGFMMKDEPGYNMFETLGYAQKVFAKAAPDLMLYINLFPVVANGFQLTGENTSTMSYDEYLSRYFNMVKADYISYDHYPLYGTGLSTSIEPSFLYNMDVMQTKIAEEGNNRRLWTFLQSISFGARNRALGSIADATFQAYSFLAYGGDGIQWFCYAAPPANDGNTSFGDNALVTRSYEKTATYTYVQEANRRLNAFMPYYDNFEWKGVMLSYASDEYGTYDDTGNFEMIAESPNVISTDGTVTGYTSDECALIGVFEDKEGRRGYLAVNFTDPALKKTCHLTLNISGKGAAVVAEGGKAETTVDINGGKLSLTLKEGEAAFVIPY